MTFRCPAAVAALAVLGLAAETAVAQPIAPARRPTFSGYSSIFSPGGGYYGYGGGGLGYGGYNGFGYGGPGFGYGGPGFGLGGGLLGQQNAMLQQQILSNSANVAGLQYFLATGVNPAYGITGRGAVFNNLGHWYPQARNGGGGFGSGFGGFGGGLGAFPTTAGSGFPLRGYGGVGGGPGGGAGGTGGFGTARTAGSGIPLPQRGK